MRTILDILSESVSSGRRTDPYPPQFGCTVEDVVEWLRKFGIDGNHWKPGKNNNPQCGVGEVRYLVGPCYDGKPKTNWVSIDNHFNQSVVIKPNIDDSFIKDREHEISCPFDFCLGVALKMIKNPTEKIEL